VAEASGTGPASAASQPELAGLLPLDQIPQLDRSSHLLYSSDINPACPNSVIEALACGLPVIAFDTGALPEIVLDGSGLVVPYGGDPWKLAPPDVAALAQAAIAVLANQDRYRLAARRRAEAAFGLDQMVEKYLAASCKVKISMANPLLAFAAWVARWLPMPVKQLLYRFKPLAVSCAAL